ncbi:uncharacterized protein A4U43_C08F31280 [Asparagus officinalis]|uniref:CASP-like protein 1E1 n=1 Tax=Asparagus officinalis TaxID=4686 RepID=UPI00098E0C88|nr:CASP-like protein 1E1 [Asparagus officinalis]ONK61563.1 uncharacterized protein A4U43_C08F31280 [Asparagus officinalis]
MGTAKQTKSLSVGGGFVDFTVKSGKSSALVYFIVINVLAFLYSAFSLAISLLKRANSKNLELPFSIADLLVTVLLFSANSAAAGLSVIAEDGNSNLLWAQICDTMNTFCAQMNASIVLSMFASLAYFLLVLLAILGFYRRSF